MEEKRRGQRLSVPQMASELDALTKGLSWGGVGLPDTTKDDALVHCR